jgi:hypothetical protein
MSQPPSQLFQTWIHSHEEDTATERVYRPAGYAFPPSRGRTGFDLRPDRTYTRIGIAARDGSTRSEGTWEYQENDEHVLTLSLGTGQREIIRIVSVAPERLVTRK